MLSIATLHNQIIINCKSLDRVEINMQFIILLKIISGICNLMVLISASHSALSGNSQYPGIR